MTIKEAYSEYLKELEEYLASEDDATVKQAYDKLQHENKRPEKGAKLEEWREFFFNGGRQSNEFEVALWFLLYEYEAIFCEGYLLTWSVFQQMPFHDGKMFISVGSIALTFVFEEEEIKSIEAKIGNSRLFAFAFDTKYLLKSLELFMLAGNGNQESEAVSEFDANAFVASLSKEGRKRLKEATGWPRDRVSRIASSSIVVNPGKSYLQIKKFAESWSQ